MSDIMNWVRAMDFHCHTYHSPCGEDEMIPEVVLRTAESRGVKMLGIMDHYYRHLLHMHAFAQLREECAGKAGHLKLLFGCEADVTDPNTVSITEEETKQFDYVLLASNHFLNKRVVACPPTEDPDGLAEYFLTMFRKAVSIPYIDIIPHPFYIFPNTYDFLIPARIKVDDLCDALTVAKQNKIAMEISPRAVKYSEQIPFFMRFYKLAKRVGLKFSIGTDAHRLELVGTQDQIEPIVREINLTVDDLWFPKGVDSSQLNW